MILSEPPPSQADLHFRILGFPVRIHPMFWVVTLIIGMQGDPRPESVFNWVFAVMISILVHELGHAFFQRRYGGYPKIVLHGMGGLAICGDCDRSTRSQIIISLAGPFAGFLLALLIALSISILGHRVGIFWDPANIPFEISPEKKSWSWFFGGHVVWEPFASEQANLFLRHMFFINVVWGAINLLPIYPLDGGKVAREICILGSPREGILLSLKISIVAAIAMAGVGLSWKSFVVVLMFGYFAYSSYQILQAYEAQSW